jgi:hypothetical protein
MAGEKRFIVEVHYQTSVVLSIRVQKMFRNSCQKYIWQGINALPMVKNSL